MSQNLNETAKLGEISLTDNNFNDNNKKEKKEFFNATKKCPKCQSQNFQNFEDHIKNHCCGDTVFDFIQIAEERMVDFAKVCSDLFVLRNMIIIRAKTSKLTPKEIRRYNNITEEMKRIFDLAKDDDTYA